MLQAVTTTPLQVLVVLALVWFSARRLLFLAAALAPPRDVPARGRALPSVTLAVPAHNEEHNAFALVGALTQLDYPPDRLSIVFVCDGCTDGTSTVFGRFARRRKEVHVIELPERVGKAQALNAALALATGDLFVVLDADLIPRPDFLRRLLSAFDDHRVGAAAGMVQPANGASSLVSGYSATNSWVHQQITSAAKDRLDLDPPTLGASAYRRMALLDVGGFRPGSMNEDLDAGLALAEAGWRTRFVSTAVADNVVADRLSEYWHQHIRWARGALGTPTRLRRHSRKGSVLRRLETWTAALDYADRFAFVGSLVLAGFGKLPFWVPAAYFAVPAAAVLVAYIKAGVGRGMPRYVIALAVMFPVDVAGSAVALLLNVARRPRRWHRTTRTLGAPASAPTSARDA